LPVGCFAVQLWPRLQSLQDRNLKHQHCIIGWSATLRSIRARQGGFQIITKRLEIMTCTSRSTGSPAVDNAFSRSSPSKKPDCPATGDPPHPPLPDRLFSSEMPVVLRAVRVIGIGVPDKPLRHQENNCYWTLSATNRSSANGCVWVRRFFA